MSEENVEVKAEEVHVAPKPLSDNACIAFFQKILRWWLGLWYGFCDKYPKAAPWIYKLFFFFVFSMSVTVWQALVMLFLPKAFTALGGAFAWPGVQVGNLTWNKPIFDAAGKLTGAYEANSPAVFAIFGDEVLGNWIAFEIAVFTAQCINFPLQRNITYKSHGNPWYQAMWYFIGWVGISFLTGAVWGIIDPLLKSWGWFYTVKNGKLVENGILFTLATLLKTFITGGVSMIIFFPIFLIIFPDRQKQAAAAKKKYEALLAKGVSGEASEKARIKAEEADKAAKLAAADKDAAVAASSADAKAVAWEAAKKRLEKMRAKGATEEELAAQQGIIEARYTQAVKAAVKRNELAAENEKVKAQLLK